MVLNGRLYATNARPDIFAPSDRERNCPIANKLYAICVEHDLVTPVWECPEFEGYKPTKGE